MSRALTTQASSKGERQPLVSVCVIEDAAIEAMLRLSREDSASARVMRSFNVAAETRGICAGIAGYMAGDMAGDLVAMTSGRRRRKR
jgi:hypothetical protein